MPPNRRRAAAARSASVGETPASCLQCGGPYHLLTAWSSDPSRPTGTERRSVNQLIVAVPAEVWTSMRPKGLSGLQERLQAREDPRPPVGILKIRGIVICK